MDSIFATAVTLFLIMDPLGNIPVFLSVLSGVAENRRRKIIWRELIIALGFMILFLFSGPTVLRILGLSREAVAIGGGLVLMIIAIRMIFPLRGASVMGDNSIEGEPLIVPLAVPLIAGPSLLATLMLLADNSHGGSAISVLPALLLAWGVTASILVASPFLFRILGIRGLKAIERLMGMILISVSVQMLLNAFLSLLH